MRTKSKTWSRCLGAALILLCIVGQRPGHGAAAEDLVKGGSDLTRQIAVRLDSPAPLIVEGLPLDRDLLTAVYRQRGNAPIWQSRPEWPAALAGALAASDDEGIPSDSLGLSAVRRALTDSELGSVERELVLTDRFLAYGAALARGRIAIASIEADWALPPPFFDPGAAVAQLSAIGPAGALQGMLPATAEYWNLRASLARYRRIAAAGGWESLPAGPILHLGDTGAAVRQLRRRLAAEGELPINLAVGEAFDARLAGALAAFQKRHGLLTDGRLGPATAAALNVTAADRAEQIRVNLERLRALPRYWPASRIEVQAASQTLVYFRDGKPVLRSRVIVGQLIHPTPVLAASVQQVILDPAWEVPTSILRQEIAPRLGRDPGYLARNHYVVPAPGRLRQLPGPWNALGSVVLDMPNPFDVYMHDTPARQLFALPERALSHGCVRVEAVRDLASALLGTPLPPPGGPTRAVPLPTPVPVYFLYQTAFSDDGGGVNFRADIYGRDAKLAAALAALDHGSRPPTVPALVAEKSCPGIATLASLGP